MPFQESFQGSGWHVRLLYMHDAIWQVHILINKVKRGDVSTIFVTIDLSFDKSPIVHVNVNVLSMLSWTYFVKTLFSAALWASFVPSRIADASWGSCKYPSLWWLSKTGNWWACASVAVSIVVADMILWRKKKDNGFLQSMRCRLAHHLKGGRFWVIWSNIKILISPAEEWPCPTSLHLLHLSILPISGSITVCITVKCNPEWM